MTKLEYNPKNFRRFIEKPDIQPRRDFNDYTKYVNEDMASRRENVMAQTGNQFNNVQLQETLRTTKGSQTFRPGTAPIGAKSFSKTQSVAVIRDYQPKLLESKVSEKNDFFKLSDGFKKVFTKTPKEAKFVVPVAGYGGHLRGERS